MPRKKSYVRQFKCHNTEARLLFFWLKATPTGYLINTRGSRKARVVESVLRQHRLLKIDRSVSHGQLGEAACLPGTGATRREWGGQKEAGRTGSFAVNIPISFQGGILQSAGTVGANAQAVDTTSTLAGTCQRFVESVLSSSSVRLVGMNTSTFLDFLHIFLLSKEPDLLHAILQLVAFTDWRQCSQAVCPVPLDFA